MEKFSVDDNTWESITQTVTGEIYALNSLFLYKLLHYFHGNGKFAFVGNLTALHTYFNTYMRLYITQFTLCKYVNACN